jgi:hypothetical protein
MLEFPFLPCLSGTFMWGIGILPSLMISCYWSDWSVPLSSSHKKKLLIRRMTNHSSLLGLGWGRKESRDAGFWCLKLQKCRKK